MTAVPLTDSPARAWEPERAARAVLARHAHLANPHVHALITRHGPVEALNLLADRNLPHAVLRVLPRFATGTHLHLQAAAALARAGRTGARIVIPGDDEWPTHLPDLATAAEPGPEAALCLWVRSNTPLAATLARSVAVVGSTAASPDGVTIASRLGEDLARQGWTVVTGGGYGIAEAAVRGALHGHGVTAAIWPTGIDRPHPNSHTSLFGHLDANISLWPPGRPRTRTQSAATAAFLAVATTATVLVEAGVRSRSLASIEHAIRCARPVLVFPGPVTSVLAAGALHVLREHPTARLVRDSTDVLTDLRAHRHP